MRPVLELRVFLPGDLPDRATFDRDFLDGSMPALFRTGQPPAAAARWSPAALGARFSDRHVTVRQSGSEQFAIDPKTGDLPAGSRMTFGELARAVRDDTRHLYMMQQPIAHVCPELLDDLALPPYVRGVELQSLNLWMGQAGNVTRLHWDNYNNFLVQLWGRKRVLLLPPDEQGLAAPAGSSRVLHQADLAGPIRVRDESGTGLRCVLDPGDYLFIPAFWWHEIESLDEAVSVNAWWMATLEQCFVHTALAALRRMPPDPEVLQIYLRTVRWGGSLWDAADLARTRGVDWLSRRFLAAALDADVRTACRNRGVRQLDAPERALVADFLRRSRDVETNGSAGEPLSDAFAQAQALRARLALV